VTRLHNPHTDASAAAKETAKMLSRPTLLAVLAVASTLAALAMAPAAQACDPTAAGGFGVAPGCFDFQISADASGAGAYTQAAGTPYAISTQIEFNSHLKKIPELKERMGRPFDEVDWPVEPVKDILVDLPPGLLGNAAALPHCRGDQLLAFVQECPAASQVGTVTLTVPVFGLFAGGFGTGGFGTNGAAFDYPSFPVFNMVPPNDAPARFGFNALSVTIALNARLRSDGDYGASVDSRGISQGLALLATKLTFWGDPTSSLHTPERACPGSTRVPPECASEAEPTSFLRLPTSCAGPQPITANVDSWWHPGAQTAAGAPQPSDPNWRQAGFLTHLPPGLPDGAWPGLEASQWGQPAGQTGCESVPFEPGLSVQPTTRAADSPSGLAVDITLPQTSDPEAIQTSDLRRAAVTLPRGMSVNPASANGLGACSEAQIALESSAAAQCPDAAKIGTVEIATPLLDHPVEGAVYLAKQGENPFKSLLAIYIAVEDPGSGVVLKLAGHVSVGPDGQLETVFDNQPQLPFEHLHLELFGGPTAPLMTPAHCGPYTTAAELSPWARPAEEVALQSSFELTSGPGGSPCPAKPAPLAPKLSAGAGDPSAGSFSPFALKLTREDGTQRFAGIDLALPPGLSGRLAGIPYCPNSALAGIPTAEGTGAAQLASPACPAASQVGKVTVGAGAGPTPFFLNTGKVYLSGPYKGAPLSLAILTPALAGPFDLGNVLVRTALRVDPESARITAVSDPLPTSLFGIPLDLRDVRVMIDRPGFALNPTSCDPMAVEGTVKGTEGASVAVSDRFQVGGCAALRFKPRLSFALSGATERGGHPAFSATLRARPGEANIARAAVTLPKSEILDQAHIRTICTRVQFAAEQCPPGSVYGYARALTPLLDKPLQGPVYLRSSSHKLPDLVASLDGQIHVDLVGRIDSLKGRIRNRFESAPDAPVSKFTLTMKGGRKGLLINSTDICAKTHRAQVKLDGHNGKIHDSAPALRADCAKGRKRGKGRGQRR
jgi:hypothetical protein